MISVSVDIVGDDWLLITPEQVMQRTLARLEQRKKGIILLHDIQNRTVQMLPALLKQLKERGYKIVHIVPDRAETQVALGKLGEPQSRSFQVAMAKTRTKIAALRPLEPAPIAGSLEPADRVPTVNAPSVQVASNEAAPPTRQKAFTPIQGTQQASRFHILEAGFRP